MLAATPACAAAGESVVAVDQAVDSLVADAMEANLELDGATTLADAHARADEVERAVALQLGGHVVVRSHLDPKRADPIDARLLDVERERELIERIRRAAAEEPICRSTAEASVQGGEDGFSIARQLREHWHCGLIIVTGRGDAVDKIVGLEVGADDYVTKPFDLRELLARIKAVLRRIEAAPPRGTPARVAAFSFAGWTLDVAARRLVAADGREVALTGGEFDLLVAFVQHPGRVLSRDFLLEQTRGREGAPFERTIDVQVGRLRKKLEVNVDQPQIIKSVRGAGYILVPSVAHA